MHTLHSMQCTMYVTRHTSAVGKAAHKSNLLKCTSVQPSGAEQSGEAGRGFDGSEINGRGISRWLSLCPLIRFHSTHPRWEPHTPSSHQDGSQRPPYPLPGWEPFLLLMGAPYAHPGWEPATPSLDHSSYCSTIVSYSGRGGCVDLI